MSRKPGNSETSSTSGDLDSEAARVSESVTRTRQLAAELLVPRKIPKW